MKEKRTFLNIMPQEKGQQLIARKKRRNEPCACKSGKKTKNCCGDDSEYKCTTPRAK